MAPAPPSGRWSWTVSNVLALAALTALLATGTAWRWANRSGRVGADLTVSNAPVAPAVEKIDPNSASWASLARLPRIGPAIGRSICAYRDAFGAAHPGQRAFTCPADLANVKGVGDAIVEAATEHLRFETVATNELQAAGTGD